MSDLHPEHQQEEQQVTTPGVSHERTDLSVSGLLWFLALLIVSGVIVEVSMSYVFRLFTDRDVTTRNGRALSSVELGTLPAQPVLEGLTPGKTHPSGEPPGSYGWVNRDAQIARIPVEQAKKVLAGTLPAQAAPSQSPPATDANGGQTRKGPT